MTTSKMSPKRFVSAKFSGKVSAEGFLSAHWEFLKGQDYLTHILEAYEKKELLPTPTLIACQQAVIDHLGQVSENKGKEEAKRTTSGTKVVRRKKNTQEVDASEVPDSNYLITLMCKVYDRAGACTIQVGTVEHLNTVEEEKNGLVVTKTVKTSEPAIFEADTFNVAARIADRHLFNRGDSVYAIIENTQGKPIQTIVNRDDAIARTLVKPKGPSVRNTSSGGSNLGFGIKAKNDRSHFSRG
jgi:hypothetical protein